MAWDNSILLDKLDKQLTTVEVQLGDPLWGVRPLENDFTTGFVRVASKGRPYHRFSYRLRTVKGHAFRGGKEMGQGAHIYGPKIKLEMQEYSETVDMFEAANLDEDGWDDVIPQIEYEIQYEPQLVFARHLNYGHLIKCWTTAFFFVDDTGAMHYANPKKKSLGQFPNALINQSGVALPDRVDRMLKMMHLVPGVNGRYLGLGNRKKWLWLPTSKYRDGYKALDVLQLVPADNGIAQGGGNTSKIVGDAIPVEVPDLRSDCIILAAQPPSNQFMPFSRLTGVRSGDGKKEINLDHEQIGAGIPEFETIIDDSQSELYKREGRLGFTRRHYRGYGLGSPHACIVSYDGLPTATDPVSNISYAALPKRLY